MKRFQMTVDRLVHDQSSLPIDNMTALVLLITAEAMGMLDNYSIRPHLNHEPAGVLNTRAGNVKFIRAMQQYDQVINLSPPAIDVSDVIH